MRKETAQKLSEIQANIVKPHGRDHCWYLFFHFPEHLKEENYQSVRKAIGEFSCQITSGLSQVQEAINRKKYGLEGKVVSCLFLSKSGLDKIRLGKTNFRNHEFENLIKQFDDYSEEIYPYTKNEQTKEEVDLMIMIADDHYNVLEAYAVFVKKFFTESFVKSPKDQELKGETVKMKHLFTEKGKVIRIEEKYYEHFGFRDGLSKIPFWKKKNVELDIDSLSIVLDEQSNSIVAFQKIYQKVNEFHERVNEITRDMHFSDSKESLDQLKYDKEFQEKNEFNLAQFFGRFRDGTLLIHFGKPNMDIIKKNGVEANLNQEFNEYGLGQPTKGGYMKYDPYGKKCPFFAHIRKANIRDQESNADNGYCSESEVRIARRGIPFESKTSEGVIHKGLLFVSYQKHHCQFTGIQRWMRITDIPVEASGIDPIAGHSSFHIEGGPKTYILKKEWGNDTEENGVKVSFDFHKYVEFEPHIFFLAPSIPWMKRLIINCL